jgi:hypothetical protein
MNHGSTASYTKENGSVPPFLAAPYALRCAGHVAVEIVELGVDGNVTPAFDKGEVVTGA